MIMNKENLLTCLEDFKLNWLPQNISNDNPLHHLITNKINELEQLLIPIENNQIENESSNANNYQRGNSSDTQEFVFLTQHQQELSESCLLTPSNKDDQIDVDDEKKENSCGPIIRIKRISLAEAERFLPVAWKINTKPKRDVKRKKKRYSKLYFGGRKSKKNAQTNQMLLSATTPDETPNGSNSKRKSIRSKKVIEHPSTSSVASTQSVNGNKKSTKRKLRALDAEDDDLYTLGNLSQIDNLNSDTNCEQIPRYIGQNGILSQTRKLNETSINVEDDFTIKLRSKKSNQKLKTKLSNDSKISESSIGDSLTIIEDVGRIHQEFLKDMSEKDQESLFDSLNITNDRTFETSSSLNRTSLINYNDCIEDISNDGIDPPPPPPPPPPEPLSSTNMSYLSLTT
ncbi:unnamed protein product [Rotaria sp. Silwood2]|nr:unnamed protein product [Rotaria sp. Silwood2]CAF3927427.1 unnamed protein product [Rotaria sp. Silwood2]CAF4316811.1 unnamed protein product [Rotaria sp. Silwood2]